MQEYSVRHQFSCILRAIPPTGIVRRIDDLGRIVIPKEIRRTLRIRMGDPLAENIDTGYGVLYGCEIRCGAVHREVNTEEPPSDWSSGGGLPGIFSSQIPSRYRKDILP